MLVLTLSTFVLLFVNLALAGSSNLHRQRAQLDVDPLSPPAPSANGSRRSFWKRFTNSVFTYYEVGQNACGSSNDDLDYTVALSPAEFNKGAHCHQPVILEYGQKQVSAIVTDQCLSCSSGDLDLTLAVFVYLAGSLEQGELRGGSWDFADHALPSATVTASSSPTNAEMASTHFAGVTNGTLISAGSSTSAGSSVTGADSAGSLTTLVDGRLSTIFTRSTTSTTSQPEQTQSHTVGPSLGAGQTPSGPPRTTVLAVAITLGVSLMAFLAALWVFRRRRLRHAPHPHLLLWGHNDESAEKVASNLNTPGRRSASPSSPGLDDVLHITRENLPPCSTSSQDGRSTLAENGSNAPAPVLAPTQTSPKRPARHSHAQSVATARGIHAVGRRSTTHPQHTPGSDSTAHTIGREAVVRDRAREPMVVMPLALAQCVLATMQDTRHRRSGEWSEGGESLPAYSEPPSSPARRSGDSRLHPENPECCISIRDLQ
ncbi:hypothetical protein OH77DRAFT_1057293 [Trametes cingulata]|nr:hypothetical protein OH77DRAFT_1057293 [Trametes cingulata]